MSFDICWYLAFASQIDDVDVRARTARTDIQTHKTTTVSLAAHTRRGLIKIGVHAKIESYTHLQRAQ